MLGFHGRSSRCGLAGRGEALPGGASAGTRVPREPLAETIRSYNRAWTEERSLPEAELRELSGDVA